MLQRLRDKGFLGGGGFKTRAPDGWVLGGLFLGFLALYAVTARPVVGFGDSAGFSLSCLNGDIAHAPGFPLYALLCHGFSWLPFSEQSPALVAAWFSAFCAAGALVLLAHVVFRLTGDAVVAVGAAAVWGASREWWGQANIPEVYALNGALFLGVTALVLFWQKHPSVPRMAVVGLGVGLGLSNHPQLFLTAAPALLPLAFGAVALRGWWRRQVRRPKVWVLCVAALGVGLLPYAYLYWRANHPVAFARLPQAPDDWGALWRIVSRQVVDVTIDNPAASGWGDRLAYAVYAGREVFFVQIGLPGGALAALGFWVQWRRLGAAAAAALTLLFVVVVGAPVLLVNFLYDAAGAQAFAPYLLLAYAAVCVWAALGAAAMFGRWRGVALVGVCVYALAFNFSSNDRRGETMGADIARVYLQKLPPGAFFPLSPLYDLLVYYQYVHGGRADVRLLPAPSLYSAQTITPGAKLYPPNVLSFEEEMARVNAYAAANPLCYNTFVPFSGGQPSREHLLFSCLRSPRDISFVTDDEVTAFLYALAAAYARSRDWSARRVAGKLLGDATRSLMWVRARRPLPPEWGELLEALSVTPAGQLALMEFLAGREGLTLSEARAELFLQAARRNLSSLNRRGQARLWSALGDCFAAVAPRGGRWLDEARAAHARAVELVPEAEAPGVRAAWRFYRREGMAGSAEGLRVRFGEAVAEGGARVVE